MIPMQYALRRRMMAAESRNGPWTVTITGTWVYQNDKAIGGYGGCSIDINGTNIPADEGTEYAVTSTQQFLVENETPIELTVASWFYNHSDYNNGYVEIDGQRVLTATEAGKLFTYTYTVHSDCTIRGVVDFSSGNSDPMCGIIKITTT